MILEFSKAWKHFFSLCERSSWAFQPKEITLYNRKLKRWCWWAMAGNWITKVCSKTLCLESVVAVSSVCVYRTKAFQQNKIFLVIDVVPTALYAEDLRGHILFVLYSAPRYWQLFEISFVKLKECFMNYVFFFWKRNCVFYIDILFFLPCLVQDIQNWTVILKLEVNNHREAFNTNSVTTIACQMLSSVLAW